MKKALLYLVCLAGDIPFGLFFFLTCLFVWTKPRRQAGCLACEVKNRWTTAWWLNRFRGGALGHFLFYRPGALDTIKVDTPLEYHESFHVKQYEGAMLNAAIFCTVLWLAGGNYIAALVAWSLGGGISYISSGIVSLLRGDEFYRASDKEEGARGATEAWMSFNDKNNN